MKDDAAEMVNAYPNWIQSFSKAALQRGERYAEEGRAELEGIHGPTITASCQGSGNNHYRQHIKLHVAGGRCHVRGDCDCPVRQNCKHCAAVLFASASAFPAVRTRKPTRAPCPPNCSTG